MASPALARCVRESTSTSSASPMGCALPSAPASSLRSLERTRGGAAWTGPRLRARRGGPAVAGGRRRGFGVGGGRAFAIGGGGGDDGRQAGFGVAELGQQPLD